MHISHPSLSWLQIQGLGQHLISALILNCGLLEEAACMGSKSRRDVSEGLKGGIEI